MEGLMGEMKDGLVIDATHPYAQVVTENIQAACAHTRTEYVRVVRKEIFQGETGEFPVVYVKNIQEAVEYLKGTRGNILVENRVCPGGEKRDFSGRNRGISGGLCEKYPGGCGISEGNQRKYSGDDRK